MTPKTLYGRTTRSISLAEATRSCAPILKGAIALLYTPSHCHLANVNEQGTCLNEEEPINYASVFEARLFCPKYEFRWLNEYEGYGRAVLLCDLEPEVSKLSDYLADEVAPLQAIDTLSQTYLLWGEGIASATPQGWSKLAAARIGRLSVPIVGAGKGKAVRLHAREYLSTEPKFGNVSVVEERLLDLVPFDIPQNNGS